MHQAEPPNRTSSLSFIGKNGQGNWVVQDRRGLCDGVFFERKAALRFALFGNGSRPQAVVMVPGVLDLDTSVNVSAGSRRRAA